MLHSFYELSLDVGFPGEQGQWSPLDEKQEWRVALE